MRRHRVLFAAVLAAAGALLVPASASALAGGQPVQDGADRFAAKITTDTASCSAALVAPQWIVTAAGCLPGAGAQPAPPAKPATVVVGRADLRTNAGQVLRVTSVVARADRDVALAKLSYPVPGVTPLPIGSAAPAAAETLRLDGFGRTTTEWAPDRLATAPFTTGAATATTIPLTSPTGDDPCLGDAGGPLLRSPNGRVELAGVATGSWQHNCLAVTGTRQGSVAARTDDIAGWIADQVAPRIVRFANHFSHRCLAVQGANNVNDAPAFQHDCPGAYEDQAWELEPQPAGGVLLRNHFTKRCLIVHSANNVNGAPLVQFDCLPQFADQLWDVVPVDGGVQLRNRVTNRCAVVFGSDDRNGSPAAQFDCLPQFADQVWEVSGRPDTVQAVNKFSQRCLAVQGSNNVNDAPAFQYDCTASFADQAWELDPQPAGGFLLRDHATKRCLIAHASDNTNGAALTQYDCLPQFADQRWDVVSVTGGVQLRNLGTNRCAVVFGSDNRNGSPAAQFDCLPQFTDQVWDLVPVPST
ncbi:RICIN domain-containing protein [Amycolatopsis sp., V23-08]|uniref:RICIN domain-containing protein n=1 Tax=Amycolatopsis heterodermiae TaxID=3110235 RepID=A0ABU5RCE4_9PSEU|nr:RICIN domain-containing protein [Amycolatopsis sp., V23-08]MEA5363931.1 RICIN domain-containing protein [Amycolatopsis sp., V23-08]